ncbi:hypothetical protein FNV43_RR09431 [Rhamnella rubrinervis]|uniref:Fungal lipase-type domain-containing protein n=1 Tax=Rhamnella rubrinervis TaxID=2594499 RepID=A0A8K0MK77_9ROSA|nr:hypothetical protein FNV43_RR09431 [Rhamnella rubrinervis]
MVIKFKIPGIQSLISKTISDLESELARRGKPIAADAGELRQYPGLRVEVGNAACDSLERMRDESKKATLKLVDMECSYLTVDFFRKLPKTLRRVATHRIQFLMGTSQENWGNIGLPVSSVSHAAQNRFRGISSGRMGRMTSGKERFEDWGPSHLKTFIDWKNENHRRSILASLVQGVYIVERDRQEKREGLEALAPRWWVSFNFKLLHNLIDDVDGSIFGAIYEFEPPPSISNYTLDGSPRCVIAFRGNLLKFPSITRDMELDIVFLQHGLHRTSRFQIAMQAISERVAAVGDPNVWLVGHSLGSAIAMLAGKKLARTGTFLSCFLFNPPYDSLPIEIIPGEKVKRAFRKAKRTVKVGQALATKKKKNQSDDPFEALSAWFPCLYVNPGDIFCCGYIGYFEDQENMQSILDILRCSGMGRLATRISTGLLMSAKGRDTEPQTEPLHLIPSANLITNSAPSLDLFDAHGIHQWWSDDLQLQYKVYEYK